MCEKLLNLNMKRKIAFEHVLQRYDYDCGVAAVSMLLMMAGKKNVDLDELQEKLKTSEVNGTNPLDIAKYLSDEKIQYTQKDKASLADLEEMTRSGFVCLVTYQAWYSEEEKDRLECGHYSLVVEVDEEYVWLIDPGIGTEIETGAGIGVIKKERKDFDKRWIDREVNGQVYDHWVIGVKQG